MRVLGIHSMGHDTGACLFEDGRLVHAIETERLTRLRHDHRADLALQQVFAATGLEPGDIDLVAASTNLRQSILGIPDLKEVSAAIEAGALERETTCRIGGACLPCLVVAHEACHAALAGLFHPSEGSLLILVNEGRGTFSRNSVFVRDGHRLSLADRDGLPWYGTGFGWSALGWTLGYGQSPSVAGTLMALSAYGKVCARARDALLSIPQRVCYQPREVQEEAARALARHPGFGLEFTAQANLIQAFQAMFSTTVHDYLAPLMARYGATGLALGGGCALNIPTNTLLRRRLDADLAVPPACNDAGQALGAAVYALMRKGMMVHPFSVYGNGEEVRPDGAARCLRDHGFMPQPYRPDAVARVLAGGGVVALCHGRAELGPRALGHRSLLANPAHPGIRKRVSEGLKQRAWFRPLAPVMTIESFARLFPDEPPSPHMLYTYDARALGFDEAMHVDGSARIQTVAAEDEPLLHALLVEMETSTGVPALLNTSLNAHGRAMAQTVDHVLDDFLRSDVRAFVFGDVMVIR